MTVEVMEVWLKSSVPGIVILGAIGSILSVLIWKFFGAAITKVFPLPYRLHKQKMTEQAYLLGYAAANIEKDKTGKYLTAYMIFRLARFIIASILFIFCFIAFLIVLAVTGNSSIGLFFLVTIGFTSLYWGYVEFEYIYRTYWFFWKGPLTAAQKSYKNHINKKNGSSDTLVSENGETKVAEKNRSSKPDSPF